MHKIVNGRCPQYFKHHISYVNNKHRNNTRVSKNNNLFIPLFRTNSGFIIGIIGIIIQVLPIMEHIR